MKKLIALFALALLCGPSAAQYQAAVPGAPFLIPCQSGAAVAAGADTSNDILVTCPIAANILGANGRIVVNMTWSFTNSGNNKTIHVYFGASGAGVGGTAFVTQAVTTSAGAYNIAGLVNRNATNSQFGLTSLSNALYALYGTFTTVSAAIDTTAATEIVISCAKASSGEVCQLENYQIAVYPK